MEKRAMRRVFLAVAIAAATVLAAAPSSAQVRAQIYHGQPRVQRIHKAPPVIILPRVIKPSMAVRRAQMLVPGAKPLNVRINKQGIYIVKVKRGNVISNVRVDGMTGDVLP